MKQKMIIEEKIIAIVLCLMVLLVFAQVLSRYVVHKSLSYTEEIVRYSFVWITFLGISAAAYRGKHLSLSASLSLFPKSIRKRLKYISGACALLFAGIIIFYGAKVTLLQLQTAQKTAAMGLPMWIIGLAVPVCSLVLIIRLAHISARKGNPD